MCFGKKRIVGTVGSRMKRLLFLLFVCSSVCADEFEYTPDSVYVMSTGDRLAVVGYNSSVTKADGSKSDPHGTPNNHEPWLNPGGVQGDVRPEGFSYKVHVSVPEGKGLFRSIYMIDDAEVPPRYVTNQKEYRWEYHKGTVFTMTLMHEGVPFEIHRSEKVGDGVGIEEWEGSSEVVGRAPEYFKSPSNCIECHSDIGKHARVLFPSRENYYHRVRGSDGRFSLDPYTRSKSRVFELRINPKHRGALR